MNTHPNTTITSLLTAAHHHLRVLGNHCSRKLLLASLALSGGILGQLSALADPGDLATIGEVFPVNESPEFEQFSSDLAMDENGDFVVVYDEFIPFGDGRFGPGDVLARVYDRDGNPRGEPILVSEQSSSSFPDPAVAVDHKGNFVATWSGLKDGVSGPPEIYARRFNRWGNPLGDEFQVNTFVLGFHGAPDIAMDHFGNFIITWTQGPFRGQQISQDGSGQGVFAQRFDKRGNPVGGEFQVNSVSAGNQANSSIALNKSGNFVIVWSSPDGTNPNGSSSSGAFVRQFDAEGVPVASEILVNEQTSGNQAASGIALNDSGLFAVLWTGPGPEADGGGVYTRLFDLEHGTVGGPIRLNPVGVAPFRFPPTTAIAMERRGHFVVTWASQNVFGQVFDGTGAAFTDVFQANPPGTSLLSNGAVALGHDGGLLVSWSSRDQDAPPLSWGIYALLLEAEFHDNNGNN